MLKKIVLRPGINRDTTNYANEGGYYECDKIRFYSGFPQKLGGWIETTPERFLGVCRQMWNWITSYSDNFVALGTNKKVYIEAGGLFYDITPIRSPLPAPDQEYTFKSPTTNNCIDTVNGSDVVNINISTHGCSVGDYITIAGAEAVGGIPSSILNAEHVVTSVVDSNNFTISVFYFATSTVTGGGGTNIFIGCQIPPGFSIQTAGYGWGSGAFGGTTGLTSEGTFTVTIASPAVLTFATYVPQDNAVIILSTDGALPTGLSPGVSYFVINSVSNTCSLSLTQGGEAINTTGTQSGTHTVSIVESPTPWGLGSPTPVNLPQRDWFFDNFDNDLVMNIRANTTGSGIANGGPIYYWVRGTTTNPQTAFNKRAVLLSTLTLDGVAPADVPESAYQVLVSQNDKHLIAFGCQPYAGASGSFDPLLIRWATQDQPNVWTPLLTNSAGFIRVSRGSRIIRALPTRQEIVVFTDTHLYSFQFLGTIEVFGLQELSDNISVMSPRSCISVNNVVYWMGVDKFYAYDGRVQTLPCTIREYIFKDLNYDQAQQIFCGTNEGYNEVWWFYCSANSTEIDRYAIYNYLEQVWYYGSMRRTAWLDNASNGKPLASKYDPTTIIDGEAVAQALIQAAVGREPGRALFWDVTIGGRKLGDINNTGDVISADALSYLKWSVGEPITDQERNWIEYVINPYMEENYITYSAYLIEIGDTSLLYQHETGLDDGVAPMESYIQSSDFDIEDGDKLMLTKRIIPDVNFRTSTATNPEVTMAVRSRNFPGSTFTNNALNEKPVIQTTVDQYTEQVFIRTRGRQMAIRISSDGLGVQWQLGAPRLDAQPDGKR